MTGLLLLWMEFILCIVLFIAVLSGNIAVKYFNLIYFSIWKYRQLGIILAMYFFILHHLEPKNNEKRI